MSEFGHVFFAVCCVGNFAQIYFANFRLSDFCRDQGHGLYKWKKVDKETLQMIFRFQIQFGWQICEDRAHGNVLWATHTARSQLAV